MNEFKFKDTKGEWRNLFAFLFFISFELVKDLEMYRIGIDLGGTKIEGIVLDTSGRELFRKRIGTQQENGYRHILNRIKELHDELGAQIKNQPHTFGIGTPGAISPRTGLMKNSNTVCLNGQQLKTDLENLLGRKIEIQNDANCFAMAEALHGAGRGKKLVFGVIMGTGSAAESSTMAKSSPVRKASRVNGATPPSIQTGRSVIAASAVAWRHSSAAADSRRATPSNLE